MFCNTIATSNRLRMNVLYQLADSKMNALFLQIYLSLVAGLL